MKTETLLKLTLACSWAFALAIPSLAQDTGSVPTIEIIRWEVQRDGGTTLVYDRDVPVGSLDDIFSFLHQELDNVRVTVEIQDADWVVQEGDNNNNNDEEVFLRFTAAGQLFYSPPPAPPIARADDAFFGAGNSGFTPSGDPPRVIYTFSFSIPQFLGKNQKRLRGEIDFDVQWFMLFSVSNDQEPDDNAGIGSIGVTVKAIEKPALAPPNPPPFADAGPDRTVPIGVDVVLDGSRTFDAFNVGFDAGDDENIFEKDKITFTWEWLAGPVRVDPLQTNSRDPIATVNFDVVNNPDDPDDYYVYRLIVDDNVNAVPSSDIVRLRVVEELPQQHPPRAIIVGPANAVTVGSVVTLCGARSCDPDCDGNCGQTPATGSDPCVDADVVTPCDGQLRFRWQQTNELGDPLDAEALGAVFQPLSGVDQPSMTWQALVPGTYYFRLLVDDGDFQATTTFSVTVVDTATSGESFTNDGTATSDSGDNPSDDSSSQGFAPVTTPAMCGAGLLPVAIVPFALVAMRRRKR